MLFRMTLTPIDIPDSIKQLPYFDGAETLIDEVNEAIEAFMLADETVIENFVPCDFHMVDQALTWMEQNHWLVGNRFCEFGSGFGAAAMLASLRGMESCGIEIEERLVDEATTVAARLDNNARFYQGSFVPRGVDGLEAIASEVKNVDTHEDDVYDEIGLDISDFDLFFAFPWPGEHPFFERVFEAGASDGSLLLSYRGRDGMHLLRKGD